MSRIVSFYSYKGGVGRSVCLANVAALLAVRGRKVVCLDCDLEAGGLHTIYGIDPRSIRYTILDILLGTGPSRVEQALLPLTHLLPPRTSNADLWLLPAVSEINKVNGVMVEQRDLPMLLGNIIDQIENDLRPDYILVDSRSGFAELAAMAIRAAQSLVCVLRPNRQNIDGLRILLDVLNMRRQSPQTFLVLSQVPSPDGLSVTKTMVESRISELDLLLGTSRGFGTRVPFAAHLALEETVAVIHHPDSALAHSYHAVADWLEEGGNQ
jgi:chromosome partitioning protein